jgi:hypothetical protein
VTWCIGNESLKTMVDPEAITFAQLEASLVEFNGTVRTILKLAEREAIERGRYRDYRSGYVDCLADLEEHLNEQLESLPSQLDAALARINQFNI